MKKPDAENGTCTFARLLGVSYQVAMFRSVGIKAAAQTMPKPEKRALTPAGFPTATMRSARSPR